MNSSAFVSKRNSLCKRTGATCIWVFRKNSGIPKWMVYNGNPIKMDDLGGPPLFLG